MVKPVLDKNQYAVVIADLATGQVYNRDLEISLNEQEPIYFIFDSLLAAIDFVSGLKELKELKRRWEYVIYNEDYEIVCVLE